MLTILLVGLYGVMEKYTVKDAEKHAWINLVGRVYKESFYARNVVML